MSIWQVLKGNNREPAKATLVLRGTAGVVVIGMVVALLVLVGRGAFAEQFDGTVQLDNAGGALREGADVRFQGVIVGRVQSIQHGEEADADTGRAYVEVGVKFDPELSSDLPRNVQARVLPATVFGTSFVELTSPQETTEFLRAGQTIPQDNSAETLELQEVLDSIDQIVTALGPAELATTLRNLAQALDGNGEQLGRTIERLDEYLTKLNPEFPRVRRNLELLSTNLEAFQRYAPELFAATDDILVAARTLVEQERNFAAIVTNGSSAFDETRALLTENEQGLVDMLLRTAVTVDVLYDERDDVVAGVLAAADFGRGFTEAMSYGRYVRIDADLVLTGPQAYGAADCPSYGDLQGRGC
ncbi:MCE family protein [Nocardioides sp. ChNu-153]|uniref:MCE family protein n=1 Tax=Nocardioides sp. ChNu-153 TaxID=2779364 RepID=UPI00264C9C26|nr:MCE family protein [Nocardioides sp. ChNu-153]MDN7121790.1 MCE family protein [Nocardioides sp. ChNu-153]